MSSAKTAKGPVLAFIATDSQVVSMWRPKAASVADSPSAAPAAEVKAGGPPASTFHQMGRKSESPHAVQDEAAYSPWASAAAALESQLKKALAAGFTAPDAVS
jgi:hypothetical protein